MNCAETRDALLETELPVHDDSSELARHVRECAACERLTAALARDVSMLRSALERRSRRGRRVALLAAASTLAAAIVIAVVRINPKSTAPVNTAPQGVVSIQVPPGKTAIVLQTRDPNVTVVWLSSHTGGGI